MSSVPLRPAVRLHPSAFIPPPSASLLTAIGCLGIAGQIVLLRELMAAYSGNEFSAGVTFAAWMLCEALGAWLASTAPVRQWADHARSSLAAAAPVRQCIFGLHGPGRTAHRLSILAALAILFSLAAVPAAILVRPLLGVLPGETLSIPLLLLATFAVVLLPAAAHGALFVTAAAIHAQCLPVAELRASNGPPASPLPFPPPQGGGNRREGAKRCIASAEVSSASNAALPATGVGSAYVWEGIGTALAGVACFLLLNRLPSLAVVALSALPLIVAAGFGRGRTRTQGTMWALGLGVLASLVFALPIERMAWSAAWRGQRVAAVANSPYGKIVRLERAGQQLILYDGLPVLAVPSTQTERIEELALLPVLLHPAPRRVLVLGHDLAIPTALARFRPDIEVTTVQLDPVLTRISLAAMLSDSSLLTPPFSLLTADPVSFVRSTLDTFDCIILTDATPSSLGESRLFTHEFYQLCRSHLAPGGLLATAGPGNPTGLSPDLVGLLSTRLRTLKAAFESVLPLAADFPLLLASDHPPGVSTETLLVRLARLSEPPKLLDSSYASSLFDTFRQEALAAALEPVVTNTKTEITSATYPRELFLNMVRENRLASPAFGALYARLGSPSIVHGSSFIVLLLTMVLLVVGGLGTRAGGRQFSRGFAILTSGFSGAAVSSLLIFAWQVRFGSVFSGVALLVAAFMLGTVLGGVAGTRAGARARFGTFAAADLVLMGCAATTVALIRGGPAGAFLVANCLAGASLGFQFAVAGSIVYLPSSIVTASESAGRRAGILTALDLVGGSLGGILTALVLVPVFGIGAAALAAGAIKLISALVQLMPTRPVSQP